jgi:PIN domain nuclease of toxin-antitoxin system
MSRLLLDTHAFLWWREDSPRVGKVARRAIGNAEEVHVSAASAWEASIKSALGKLRLPEPFEDGVHDSEFLPLAVSFAHAERAGSLPAHHRDPFDRMLIAQALVEGLTIVTHDRRFEPYGVPITWL